MAGNYPNSGALFPNNRATNPKAPQWQGDIEFDADLLRALVTAAKAGKQIKVRLAGWVRQTKSGDDFISLTGSIPQERQEAPRQQPRPAASADLDDDIPF
jgi:hypothetical protein